MLQESISQDISFYFTTDKDIVYNADVPIIVSLIRSYIKKEYTDVPIGTVIAILSALIYFVSLIDIFQDSIPV